MSKPVIAVIGSTMMDLIAYADVLPAAGQTLVGKQFQTGCGGKGANQAVMASIAGADVYFIGKVGIDGFGDEFIKAFKKAGINDKYLQRDENLPTGVAPIWVDGNGQNRIIIVPGANHTIDAEYAAKAVSEIPDLKILIGQCEIKQEVTLACFKAAKARGVTTILNPAPFEKLSDELVALCDWIIPNESEYEAMGSVSGNVLLTEGEKGARVIGTEVIVPAIKVNAIDTSGAGDCFVGAFAASLASGKELQEAMLFGCAAAGLSVTKKGTQSSFPTLTEINAIL